MSIDLHTLAGAYAIDALSAEEAREFVKHLEECEACRDEVRELQSAAATLGASEAATPPPALRARVLAAADQLPQMPPKVVPIDRARSRRWTARIAPPRRPWCWWWGRASASASCGTTTSRP